jgi:hypothetical protein
LLSFRDFPVAGFVAYAEQVDTNNSGQAGINSF